MKLSTLDDALWSAQDGRCWICNAPMRKGGLQLRSASKDHVWPKSTHGNLGDVGVALLAHRFCNDVRGNTKPSDADIRKLLRVYRRVPAEYLEHCMRIAGGQMRNGGYWAFRYALIGLLLGRGKSA